MKIFFFVFTLPKIVFFIFTMAENKDQEEHEEVEMLVPMLSPSVGSKRPSASSRKQSKKARTDAPASSSAASAALSHFQSSIIEHAADYADAVEDAAAGGKKTKKKQEPGFRHYCFTVFFGHGLEYADGSIVLPKNSNGDFYLPEDMCNIKIGTCIEKGIEVESRQYLLKDGFLRFKPLVMPEKCMFMTYQLERCPETSKPHFQGYCEMKKRERATAVRKLFKAHWEVRGGTQQQAIDYCHTSNTRIGEDGQRFYEGFPIQDGKGFKFVELIEAIKRGENVDEMDSPYYIEYLKKNREASIALRDFRKPTKAALQTATGALPIGPDTDRPLFPWQQFICDLVSQPVEPRVIYWFADTDGRCGKTAFTRYLIDNHNAAAFQSTCAKELAYLWEQRCGQSNLMLFDIERDSPTATDYNVGVMEKVKGGFLQSTKYESKLFRFAPPHIVVFSNQYPDYSKATPDVWRIFNLIGTKETGTVKDVTDEQLIKFGCTWNAEKKQFILPLPAPKQSSFTPNQWESHYRQQGAAAAAVPASSSINYPPGSAAAAYYASRQDENLDFSS
nr:putative replication associated protein [Crucivirus sp.]